ncbi:MAG: terpene cyclase/mutase family protein [Chloroflexi bacterium]|nr:terpene cyclase/mutase family protein [Chloroflexota bacterium]
MVKQHRFQLTVYILLILFLTTDVGNALATSPRGSFWERQQAVADALIWLKTLQKSDGHIGGLGTSCEAAWVVAVAGENPAGPVWTSAGTSLLAACEADVPTYLARRDAGRMGKVLQAVAATEADPRAFGGLDLISELENKYDAETGFYHSGSLFRHVLAMMALHEAGRSIPQAATDAMLQQQRPDGGWSWVIDPDLSDGFATIADVDTSGRVLQALHAMGLSPNHPAFVSAVAYLIDNQNSDAGWGDDDISNSDSTALAIEGLLVAGWDPESAKFEKNGTNPVTTLLSFQEASGAFVFKHELPESRMLATTDSIPALSHPYPADMATPLRFYLPAILSP